VRFGITGKYYLTARPSRDQNLHLLVSKFRFIKARNPLAEPKQPEHPIKKTAKTWLPSLLRKVSLEAIYRGDIGQFFE
jgi:hypothetical protein